MKYIIRIFIYMLLCEDNEIYHGKKFVRGNSCKVLVYNKLDRKLS